MSANYREYILSVFERRKGLNSAYSLRAFARDLKISAPLLSQILKRKRGLSHKTAEKVSSRLFLSETEKSFFLALVAAEHARSPITRKIAQRNAETLSHTHTKNLDLDTFHLIADCHHFALLQILKLSKYKNRVVSLKKIAKELGISVFEVERIVERLEKLQLIKKRETSSGNIYEPIHNTVFTTDGVPSEALRAYHTQVMSKAQKAIHFQDIGERMYRTSFLSVDPKDIVAAQEMINQFSHEFMSRFGGQSSASKVYSLGVQFFNHTQEKEK